MPSQPGLFFDVTVASEVFDADGRVIGRLVPSNRYHAHAVTDTHLVMRSPGGTDAFVSLGNTRVVEEVHPVEPTTSDARKGNWTLWTAGVIFLVVAAAGWFLLPDSTENSAVDSDDSTIVTPTAEPRSTATSVVQEPTITDEAVNEEPDARFTLVKRGEAELENAYVVGTSREFVFLRVDTFSVDGATFFEVVSKATGELLTRIDAEAEHAFPTDFLDLGDEIWISQANDRAILVLSVECVCVTRTIPVETNGASFVDIHDGVVWLDDYSGTTAPTGSTISLVDPTTEQIVKRLPVVAAGNTATGLLSTTAIGRRIFSSDSDRIWVFDRDAQELGTTIELGGAHLSPVHDSSGTAILTDRQLALIHGVSDDLTVRTRSLATADSDTFSIDWPLQLSRPAVDEATGLIWVTAPVDRELIAVDADTFDEVHRIEFTDAILEPVLAHGHVWLIVGAQLLAFDARTAGLAYEHPDPADSARVVDDTLWIGFQGTLELFDFVAN